MSARILVVDDILPNVKLLEAKLLGEYYEVLTATSGQEGIDIATRELPDLILLDVMMPGMDGFEVCEKLKDDPITTHIPIVMVTALTDTNDRVRGLKVGADDFLSKPVNDIALMARVRSLVRMKMTFDEWRTRQNTANQFGVFDEAGVKAMDESHKNARILVVEDKSFETEKFLETLKRDNNMVMPVSSGPEGITLAKEHEFDLITISLNLAKEDGLRLCSHLRSSERTRSIPIIMVAQDEDLPRISQGLEIGAHDYILRPVDQNELLARVRTQIRRKRYQDRLRNNYESSLSMALTDELTGLFNRRYFMTHGEKTLRKMETSNKPVGVLMMDIDHFKNFNDTYGHAVGDEVLKTFADRISKSVRSFDIIARQGGEEFCAMLPDTKPEICMVIAERLRKSICDTPIVVSAPEGEVSVSVSIGGTIIENQDVGIDEALKIADDALYKAKESGRNCCYFSGGTGKLEPEDIVAIQERARANR